MSNKIPDAVVVANREKTTEICESLVQVLDRGISNGIERPEAEANTAVQAVTGKQ
jgi:hypothetical protein